MSVFNTHLHKVDAEYFSVQVIDAGGNTHAKFEHLLHLENVAIQIVVQRAQTVILGNQPELSGRISRRHVRSKVRQNVGVANSYRAMNRKTFVIVLRG